MAKKLATEETTPVTAEGTAPEATATAAAAATTGVAEPQQPKTADATPASTPAAGTSPAAAAAKRERFAIHDRAAPDNVRYTDSVHVAFAAATEGYAVTDSLHGNRDYAKACGLTPRDA